MSANVHIPDLINRIKDRGARQLSPVFEEAVALTEQWLVGLSDKQRAAGETDNAGKERDALRKFATPARIAFLDELAANASRVLLYAGTEEGLGGLSLIDDESLDLQLAHEHLADALKRRHRAGLAALDQRMGFLLGGRSLGVRLPLGAVAIADAARAGIKLLEVESAVRSMVFRRFEELVSPGLFDLHKEFNDDLARRGVLPDLVVADEDERRRAEARSEQARGGREEVDDDEGDDDGAGSAAATPAPEADRALLATLVELLKAAQSQRALAPPTGPTRELAHTETLSVLSRMQREPPSGLAEALAGGDGALADILKRDLLGRARTDRPDAEAPTLPAAEDVSMDLVGQMFQTMMGAREFAPVAVPLMAKMVAPFAKAAMLDPELFAKPAHPARRLLNTVTEAVEDNAGESAQELELLQQVGEAVDRLADDFNLDMATFEQIERDLQAKMEALRRRVSLSERRSADAQKGQERLELARTQAAGALQACTHGREMPLILGEFLDKPWQHHLTMVGLRQGPDSDAWRETVQAAKRWMDLVDMASLGEPVPSALPDLREATRSALASSGVPAEAADQTFDALVAALNTWAGMDRAAPVPVSAELRADGASADERAARDLVSVVLPPVEPAGGRVIGAGARPKPSAEIIEQMLAGEPPATEEELAAARALTVGTWLEMPNHEGEMHVVKLSWISGISGLMMFVNRRGARVGAASPEELALLKRQGKVLVHDREAPVDQALTRMAHYLRRQAGAATPD